MGIIFVIRNNLGNDYPCAQTLKARKHARAIWKSAKQAITCNLKTTKGLLFCQIFAALFFISPSSLRAEIIYNVGRQLLGNSLYGKSDYAGNSFLTGSAPSTLNSISLYLGRQKPKIGSPSYPTGTLYLDIYVAQEVSGLYVPNKSTKLATASIDVSSLPKDVAYPTTLTPFTYTGVNAITLSANTNYAFYLNASAISFPTNTAINYLLNNGSSSATYPNGNYFNNSNPNGDSSCDMSGQIDVTYAAVPEPGTMILFGVTMAIGSAVAVIRKRRKRNAD